MMHVSPFARALAVASLTIAPLLHAQGGRGGRGGAAPPVINATNDPALAAFRWRSIGPANPGGRIDDIAVSESNPNVIYIGYAVSGVFKSENNGVTWRPIFETYGTHSIGDIAVHPTNPDIVYVGTGETNNRQSASFGDGIYKSTDGGATFTHIGLRETQTISRIVIDPRNPEVVYVAANGHLFGPNPDRGIYKSTNGGQTWTKVKFIDDNTGFTDIVMDPSNPSTLYAASYQRRRTSWGFNGGGPGSGIWKSTDAGASWTRITGGGLPTSQLGRIALDVTRANPNVVYAQIEVGGALVRRVKRPPSRSQRRERWRVAAPQVAVLQVQQDEEALVEVEVEAEVAAVEDAETMSPTPAASVTSHCRQGNRIPRHHRPVRASGALQTKAARGRS